MESENEPKTLSVKETLWTRLQSLIKNDITLSARLTRISTQNRTINKLVSKFKLTDINSKAQNSVEINTYLKNYKHLLIILLLSSILVSLAIIIPELFHESHYPFSNDYINSCHLNGSAEINSFQNFVNFTNDVLTGTGVMRKYPIFIGSFSNFTYTWTILSHDFFYDSKLAYFFTVVLLYLMIVISLCIWLNKQFISFIGDSQYGQNLLILLMSSINLKLNNKKIIAKFQKSFIFLTKNVINTTHDTILLRRYHYVIRALIWTFWLFSNIVAAYTIILAYNLFEDKTYLESISAPYRTLMLYVPSLVISFFNILIPMFFEYVVQLEKYVPHIQESITLIRCSVIKILTLLYIFYLNTFQSPDKCSCHLNEVGSRYYNILVVNMLSQWIKLVLIGIIHKFSQTVLRRRRVLKFSLSEKLLEIVYLEAIIISGFPFCPWLPLLALIHLIVYYFLIKLMIEYVYTKKNPVVFIQISSIVNYILRLLAFICALINFYFNLFDFPIENCGPFSIKSTSTNGTSEIYFTDIVLEWIKNKGTFWEVVVRIINQKTFSFSMNSLQLIIIIVSLSMILFLRRKCQALKTQLFQIKLYKNL